MSKFLHHNISKFRNILSLLLRTKRSNLYISIFQHSKISKLSKKTQNILLLIILILLLLVVLIAGGKLYLHYQIKHPFSFKENSQIFIVSPGETAREIAQNLEKRGLINNSLYFLIYLKTLKNNDNTILTIKAGKYLLSPSLNIPQITEKLVNGSIISSEIKITIPEGYNIFEIGNRLEKAGLVKLEEFLRFSAEHTFKNSVLVQCSEQVLCSSVFPMEGYLFPDTYQFKKDTSIESIIKKMSNNFQNKVRNLIPTSHNLTDVIITASLLEKEITSYYDRQVVAGIMEKRIKTGMPLQIDSSILYAKMLALNNTKFQHGTYTEKNEHNPVSIQDTKIDSPYNTYKYKGLPSGPICNPGINAIKAALNPIKTDYWYYLNTEDGKTVFSKTYEEHLEAKKRFLR